MSKKSVLRASLCNRVSSVAIALLLGGALPTPAHAAPGLPSGGSVVAGAAKIANGTSVTTITQTTDRAVINWSAFSVAVGKSVQFNQPDAVSATLNRVTGATVSTIAGQITANGSVYLVNPNGIAITATGAVRTGGGFVASTLGISNRDFMAGTNAFAGNGRSRSVRNAGSILAGDGGYVALLGGIVANTGTITVPAGKVALGSGEAIALDLNGGNFLQVAVPSVVAGTEALVSNSGRITAAGGAVMLSAASAKSAVRNVVNMSGAIDASSATSDGGTIHLLGGQGGTVTVSGTLTARATGSSGDGGFVETSGAHVDFAGLRVDTGSVAGKSGMWLIDPTDLNIDQPAADTISTNLLTTDVTLTTFADGGTGNGDINLNGTITWNSNHNFSIDAFNDVNFNAALIWNGTDPQSGTFNVRAGNNVVFNAPVTWNSGFGLFFNANNDIVNNAALSSPTNTFLSLYADNDADGAGTVRFGRSGSVSTAGAVVNLFYNPLNSDYTSPNDYSGSIALFDGATGTGSFLFPYMLVNTLTDLQAINTNLAGQYALNKNIDASSTATANAGAGFVPIGTDGSGGVLGNGFTGQFNGQDFVIDALTVNRPTENNVGLFGVVNGVIGSLQLTRLSIFGGNNVGGVAGLLDNRVAGTCTICGPNNISGVSVSGDVAGNANTGGVVGFSNADLSNNNAFGIRVRGTNGVGGIVGTHQTGAAQFNITDSSSTISGGSNVGGVIGVIGTADVQHLSSSAHVIGSNGTGGVIGSAFGGTIFASDASGLIDGSANVGGFIGVISSGVTVTSSTSRADVNGSTAVGGFVGMFGQGGSIDGSSATGNVNGTAFVGGFVGAMNADSGSLTSGTITNSRSGGDVTGGDYTGGFAGYVSGARLSDVSAGYLDVTLDGTFLVTPQVTGSDNVGGLVGFAELGTSIFAATSYSRVSGANSVGGLAGQLITGSTLVSSDNHGAVVGTGDVVGGAVGYMTGNLIQYVTNDAPVAGHAYVGGIVGNVNAGDVRDVTATGNVSGDTETGYWIGGVAGHVSGGTLVNIAASGNVTGNAQVGGAVGFLASDSSIDGATATGTVDGSGTQYANFDIGGLVGFSAGQIANAQASGLVSGYLYVGGLVGWSDNGASISLSSSNGSVAGVDLGGRGINPGIDANQGGATFNGLPFQTAQIYDIGGLAGLSNGQISTSVSYSDVFAASTSQNVGGLAGEAGGSIQDSAANGAVTGGNATGGLVGTLDNVSVFSSFANGNVAGADNVGGLVGFSDGGIFDSGASGSVSGGNSVGGLLGMGSVNSQIARSFAQGGVTFTQTGAGGLVGYDNGTINVAYASGNVTGSSLRGSTFSAGGLVGIQNNGVISDAYATGAVSADINVGGLVGGNTGGISNTYAVGAVTGSTNVGGLIGYNLGTGSALNNSYWDTQTTGQASGFGLNDGFFNGQGFTTAQLQDISTFRQTYAGFDFNSVWAPPNLAGQGGQANPHYAELYAINNVSWVQVDDQSRIYGNANPELSYTLHGTIPPDFPPTLSTTADTTSGVGTYAITQSGASSEGARLVVTDGTLTVTPRDLFVAADPQSTTYGGGIPQLTYSVAPTDANSGLVNGDGLTGSIVTTAGDFSSVGLYSIDQGGLDAGPNYALTFTGATLSINPASLTVTYVADPARSTYGTTPAGLTGTVNYSGLVNGDGPSSVTSGTATFATSATAASPVGQYDITGSGLAPATSNYDITFLQDPGNGTALTIDPAALTITYIADPATRLFGAANPPLTGSVSASGLVNGDTIGGVTTGAATFSTNAVTTSNVGTYAITGSGLAANSGNYSVSFVQDPGNATAFTITPAGLSVIAADLTGTVRKTYDGTTAATLTPANFLLSGFVNGDGASVNQTVGTYATANAGSGIGVTAQLSAANFDANPGTNLANYILPTFATGNVGVIDPATLTVTYTANPLTRTYGQFNGVLAGATTITGLVGSDALTTVTRGRAAFSTTATQRSDVGSYAITGGGITSVSGNYVINAVQDSKNATALTINPAVLTVTYLARTVVHTNGSAIGALTGSVQAVGLLNGDSLATITSGTAVFTTGASANSAAGLYAITGSGLVSNTANYTIRFLQSAANAFAFIQLPVFLH